MATKSIDDYELPDELDFSKMKRIPNPFVQDFRELNLVSLDADVRAVFPDSEAVNAALRELIEARKVESSERVSASPSEAA